LIMKIAQIVCVYPPYKGGIGTSAQALVHVLSLAGLEVKTFTVDYGGKFSPPFKGESSFENRQDEVIRLKAFPKLGKGGFLPQLFWRLENFDLIYFHYPFFGVAEIIWFLKKFIWKKKKKLVIHYHMDTVLPSFILKVLSMPSALIFNSLFKEADLIVSASLDYVKNSRLKNVYKKYQEKFVEIPFGVDTEKFVPAKFVFPAEPGLFKILFAGGLDKAHYFKGVNILLEAAAKLEKEKVQKDWRLEIVGDGDLRPEYEKQARELGIADKVIFAGRVSDEDLPKKYQAADCLVLPSINKSEAFGIVLIEAMASGLPVIASNLPGVRGVFTEASGCLIKPGGAEDLKEKIKFLMENPAKRLEMGKTARRLVEEKYDWKKIGERLEEEIRKLKK